MHADTIRIFKYEEQHGYEIIGFFKLYSYLNLLEGILQELIKLNIKSKYDMVDITISNAIINFIILNYHVNWKSKNGPMLGHTSKNLGKFLRKFAINLQSNYENNTRYCIIHALAADGHNTK